MPPTSPPTAQPPHPLAERLLHELGPVRAIDVGSGSGRNARALRAAGCEIFEIEDAQATPEGVARAPGSFAAAISTHALLHGTPQSIGALLDAVAGRLGAGARLYATFGSVDDARCGEGDEIEPFVFAPREGDERGVAHAFFDEPRLRALLTPRFEIVSLEEHRVDAIAGTWAHRERPLAQAAHWFVVALVAGDLRVDAQ